MKFLVSDWSTYLGLLRDNHLLRNAGLIIQNSGLFMSAKHYKIQKNKSVKNQKEQEKVGVRKHVCLIFVCILTLDVFCLMIQILLTLNCFLRQIVLNGTFAKHICDY